MIILKYKKNKIKIEKKVLVWSQYDHEKKGNQKRLYYTISPWKSIELWIAKKKKKHQFEDFK